VSAPRNPWPPGPWRILGRGVRRGPAKVLAVASSGGHWVELLRLQRAFEGHDVAYASVSAGCRVDVPTARFHVLPDVTRWEPRAIPGCLRSVVSVLAAERPDVVVSTGALPGLLALTAARAVGIRTLWLDSLANAERLSGSGQAARFVADLWLTQWPDLARPSGPHHLGAVL